MKDPYNGDISKGYALIETHPGFIEKGDGGSAIIEKDNGVRGFIRRYTPVVCVVLLVGLSACAQNNAGLVHATVSFKDGKPTKAEIISGREQAEVELDADFNTGKFRYAAKDVKAFEGQAIRAEVDKALADALPGMVESAVNAAVKALAP